MTSPDCPFCRVANADSTAAVVLEDPLAVAFLDIRPVNPGHTLVIPRRHVASFTELAHDELEALWRMAQRAALALKSGPSGCEGVTLSLADGAAAGQEVPHAHLHVIPRHANDGFGWKRFGVEADRGQFQQIASQVLAAPQSRRGGEA